MAFCLCSVHAQDAIYSPASVGIQNIASVRQQFLSPPDDARIMMRWWWFGAGVVKPELQREIEAMKSGGIGGFEIQPVYPLAFDDPAKSFVNLPYLSAGFLDDVKFASSIAQQTGMRLDMTLASGWPYGGPHISVDEASARLRVAAVGAPKSTAQLVQPPMKPGEHVIAIFSGEGSPERYDMNALHEIRAGQTFQSGEVLVFFIEARTGQKVKRPAVGAEGFVLDHFSKAAIETHLHDVGDKLMTAFPDKPPYAVFSDSLEVYNADWTGDLLAEFKRRRGYDLTPYLPQLYSGTGPESAAVRHDWGVTLTELIDENYLTPIDNWADAHHTRFRSQTYGFPAVSLSSNRLVALPEGEGSLWNRFSFTRWATSASHLYDRPITSSETWTWLDSPPFRANPLDMKAEADRFFLEGVNQLIGHGWPYTPPGVPDPGWSFYAAAVFDDRNPWWIAMPDVTRYLQRASYVLRQGKPANDVAVLLPNDDCYALFSPGKVSLSDLMPKFITPELSQAILSAGYNLDYIDAEAIKLVGVRHPAIVLPHVERLSPETLDKLSEYAKGGGKIVAVGSIPSLAPGFLHADAVSAEVKAKAQRLFHDNPNARLVPDDAALAAALKDDLAPDMKVSDAANEIGFIHRKLNDADAYFVVNTGNHPVHTSATFRSDRKAVSSWDLFSARIEALPAGAVDLELAPYESRLIVFSDDAEGIPQKRTPVTMLADLTHDWKVDFADGASEEMKTPVSWTDNSKTRFYSGIATYTKTISLTPQQLAGARSLALDFGEGTPVEVNPRIRSGTRALLDPPIQVAAIVRINGQRAGSVWHPPYTIDVTPYLHAGDNLIEIKVANTAINELADRPPANYSALNARYGERFTPQDMDNLKPLPSGILGGVRLMETK